MKIPIFLMFYDNFIWTKTCINRIIKFTNKDKYNLILINNGSNSKTVESVKMLDSFVPENFINFENPISIYSAYNIAIKKKSQDSDFFVIIHNDTFVTENWLEGLENGFNYSFKSDIDSNDILSVFPRTNYCNEGFPTIYDNDVKMQFLNNKIGNKEYLNDISLQSVLDKTYNSTLEEYAEKINLDNSGQYKITQEICSFCTMFRTKLFFDIGMFDEEFIDYYGEKYLSYIANKNMLFSINCLDVYVHHNGNTTGDGIGKDFRRNYDNGNALFLEKIRKEEDLQREKILLNTKMMSGNCSILVARDEGIGDIIMSMFVLSGLKNINRDINITYATSVEFMDFIKIFSCVDNVIPIPDHLLKIQHKNDIELIDNHYKDKFDIVINLCKLFEYNKRNDDTKKHRIQIMKDFTFSKIGNFKFEVKHPELKNIIYNDKFKDIFYKNYIVIAPDASCNIRSMSDDLMKKIIEIESKDKFVVILGKEKRMDVSELNRKRSGDYLYKGGIPSLYEFPIIDLSSETSIVDVFSIISKSQYVYAVDSGVFHIASVLGVPCRSFWGSIPPKLRCGYYNNENKIYKKEMPCSPCFDIGCDKISCMEYYDEEIEKIVKGQEIAV